MNAQDYDVIVIGGGPGGSTAGALLAERGWKVGVFEKDRHPRFHIGESLLPQNNELFQRLGVMEQVERIGLEKRGAQFSSKYHNQDHTFYFSNALDKTYPYGFEVHRADLDHLLIENCRAKGAHVREETKVTRVDFRADGVTVAAQGPEGETTHSARFLIDASGRDTFLANLFKSKQPNRKHASAAIYGHYENAQRLPGDDAGNITIFWFDHGWFWYIPLTRGITSVGAVCWPSYLKTRKTSLEEFFEESIATVPELSGRLREARRVAPVTATGNYSYQCRAAGGKNYLMVGDAFAFIDPVFSTGVYLAMASAFRAADAVERCLREPKTASSVLRRYEKVMRMGLSTFSWFIYRVTTPTMRSLILNPRNLLRVEEALISLLAGDIYRRNGVMWRIRFFQLIYYIGSALDWRNSLAAMRRRRELVRPAAP